MKLALTRTRKLADISNIAAGATRSDKIGIKKNIHAIVMYFQTSAGVGLTKAEMIADIDMIRLRMNGVQIFEATVQEILDLYHYKYGDNGSFTEAGCLPLIFKKADLPINDLRRGYALGMGAEDGPINVLTYEIDFNATVSKAATGKIWVQFDDEPSRPFGAHIRTIRHHRTHSATGVQEITDMPVKSRKNLLAYHFHKGGIESVHVKYNGVDIKDQEPYDLMKLAMHSAERTPQSGYTHVPFDLDNDADASLPMGPGVDDFVLKPNWSTSPGGAYIILEESVYFGL